MLAIIFQQYVYFISSAAFSSRKFSFLFWNIYFHSNKNFTPLSNFTSQILGIVLDLMLYLPIYNAATKLHQIFFLMCTPVFFHCCTQVLILLNQLDLQFTRGIPRTSRLQHFLSMYLYFSIFRLQFLLLTAEPIHPIHFPIIKS